MVALDTLSWGPTTNYASSQEEDDSDRLIKVFSYAGPLPVRSQAEPEPAPEPKANSLPVGKSLSTTTPHLLGGPEDFALRIRSAKTASPRQRRQLFLRNSQSFSQRKSTLASQSSSDTPSSSSCILASSSSMSSSRSLALCRKLVRFKKFSKEQVEEPERDAHSTKMRWRRPPLMPKSWRKETQARDESPSPSVRADVEDTRETEETKEETSALEALRQAASNTSLFDSGDSRRSEGSDSSDSTAKDEPIEMKRRALPQLTVSPLANRDLGILRSQSSASSGISDPAAAMNLPWAPHISPKKTSTEPDEISPVAKLGKGLMYQLSIDTAEMLALGIGSFSSSLAASHFFGSRSSQRDPIVPPVPPSGENELAAVMETTDGFEVESINHSEDFDAIVEMDYAPKGSLTSTGLPSNVTERSEVTSTASQDEEENLSHDILSGSGESSVSTQPNKESLRQNLSERSEATPVASQRGFESSFSHGADSHGADSSVCYTVSPMPSVEVSLNPSASSGGGGGKAPPSASTASRIKALLRMTSREKMRARLESEDSDAFTNWFDGQSEQSEERDDESTIVAYVEPSEEVQTANLARLQTEESDAFTSGYVQKETRARLETEESDAFTTFQSRPSKEYSAMVGSSALISKQGKVSVTSSPVVTAYAPRSQLEADLVCSSTDSDLTRRIIGPPRIRSGAVELA